MNENKAFLILITYKLILTLLYYMKGSMFKALFT